MQIIYSTFHLLRSVTDNVLKHTPYAFPITLSKPHMLFNIMPHYAEALIEKAHVLTQK